MGAPANSRNFWTGEGLGIEDLLTAAAGEGRAYADRQLLVTRTVAPYGLVFVGEIDVTNSNSVSETLAMSLSGDEALHVDVSGLIFCDIAGIRAFVDAAQGMNQGRLLMHGLPPLLRRVMNVTGWSDMPSMELCSCGAGAT